MALEIERKFLVSNCDWQDSAAGIPVRQGYLSVEKARTVRVRRIGDLAFITIKGAVSGVTRAEYEYAIPVDDADALLNDLCLYPQIEKTRYLVQVGRHTWEVDVFHRENAGLIVAEIELSEPDEHFERPSWLGDEVSDDARYFNSSLLAHPFSTWEDTASVPEQPAMASYLKIAPSEELSQPPLTEKNLLYHAIKASPPVYDTKVDTSGRINWD